MQNSYLDRPGSVGTGDPDPQVRYFAGIPTGQPAGTCGSTLLVSSLIPAPLAFSPCLADALYHRRYVISHFYFIEQYF